MPKLPINHGMFVITYSLSKLWNRIPAPYVAFPSKLSMKNSKLNPSQERSRWFLMICGTRAPRYSSAEP